MIIQCEKCATRFKVADDKVTAQGIKVRCSKCQHVFTARAGDGSAVSSGGVSRPSGIFAAPSSSSPASSSGAPSSGSVGVPHASIAGQDPGFDPFKPPPPSPNSAHGLLSGGGQTFGFEDAPAGAASLDGDRSLFGPANQTIGGFDDDDVPAPPAADPEPPAPPPPAPPTPTPSFGGGDPFSSPLHASGAGDPFASQPPSPAGAFGDPFGAPSGPSAGAAFPSSGDPFGAAASADPFEGGAPPPPPDAFGPAGGDPFSSGGPPPFGADGGDASGGDPFAGLGVEVEDAYAPSFDDEPPPAPPETPAMPAAPPAPAPAAKAPAPPPEKPKKPKRRLRIPAAVPRALWAAVQACILVTFLTLSVVWVRGGSAADIGEGEALDVVLGRAAANGESGAPLRVEDVVVARRPVDAAADLVVVSGFAVNAGDADAPAAKVTVRFGEGTAESAWANAKVDGVDLATAPSAAALLALNDRLPEPAAVAAGGRAPFVVLLRGVADGDKAEVTVEVSEPPSPPAPAAVAPPEPDDDAKGKKVRRRSKRGQPAADTPARPRAKRARASGP